MYVSYQMDPSLNGAGCVRPVLPFQVSGTFTYSPRKHAALEHQRRCFPRARGGLRCGRGQRKLGEQGNRGRGGAHRRQGSDCFWCSCDTVWGDSSFPLPFQDLPAGLIVKSARDRGTRKIAEFNYKCVYGNPTHRGGPETNRGDGGDMAFRAKDAVRRPGLQGGGGPLAGHEGGCSVPGSSPCPPHERGYKLISGDTSCCGQGPAFTFLQGEVEVSLESQRASTAFS
ncbi:hypothetical protein HJG60_008557 [Phyllostomus discolor]|uniref:Uncharacterized protein n=1 Tax=Phyllostomus discolor TaxID=89673 RepID=A0A834DI36_9CHIR|nr:hypothetical protein HJG60_008557 [Phyllostomus discolor]